MKIPQTAKINDIEKDTNAVKDGNLNATVPIAKTKYIPIQLSTRSNCKYCEKGLIAF